MREGVREDERKERREGGNNSLTGNRINTRKVKYLRKSGIILKMPIPHNLRFTQEMNKTKSNKKT